MTSSLAQNAGVDISKDVLDVAIHPGNETAQFSNDEKGLKKLTRWLADRRPARVAFEATGAYHRLFERTLAQAGLAIVKVNPKRARRFAEAVGNLAKTDRCDALMLARMGAALDLVPRPVITETLDEMKELVGARDALIKDRTAALTRRQTARAPLLLRQLAARLRQIDKQIAAVEKALKALLRADDNLNARFEILLSIPGVGEVTAYVLLVEISELGTLEPGQASALAGLAPFAQESGKFVGKRCIRGGRARGRQALYMAALSATKPNGPYSAKYQALIKAGKPAKVALVAVMRKLLLLANALLRDKRKWASKAPCAQEPREMIEPRVSVA